MNKSTVSSSKGYWVLTFNNLLTIYSEWSRKLILYDDPNCLIKSGKVIIVLGSFLLSSQEAEKHLSDMVVSKALVAKIDRPLGVICFQAAKDSNDILNSWASNLEKLLELVEKSCHQIHKETMVHKAALSLKSWSVSWIVDCFIFPLFAFLLFEQFIRCFWLLKVDFASPDMYTYILLYI